MLGRADITYSIPGLFMFLVDSDAKISFEASIHLEGNVIDVVFIPQSKSIVYSVDAVHQPFSTTTKASAEEQDSRPSVGVVQATKLGWERKAEGTGGLIAVMQKQLETQRNNLQDGTMEERSIRELLYNIASLRKRNSENEN
jgi:hypothetical protein